MPEPVAVWVLTLLGVYVAAGLAVGTTFVIRGVGRIDPAAVDGTWGFRLAILPAAAALWPFVLRCWRRGGPPPEERNAHRDLARSRGAR